MSTQLPHRSQRAQALLQAQGYRTSPSASPSQSSPALTPPPLAQTKRPSGATTVASSSPPTSPALARRSAAPRSSRRARTAVNQPAGMVASSPLHAAFARAAAAAAATAATSKALVEREEAAAEAQQGQAPAPVRLFDDDDDDGNDSAADHGQLLLLRSKRHRPEDEHDELAAAPQTNCERTGIGLMSVENVEHNARSSSFPTPSCSTGTSVQIPTQLANDFSKPPDGPGMGDREELFSDTSSDSNSVVSVGSSTGRGRPSNGIGGGGGGDGRLTDEVLDAIAVYNPDVKPVGSSGAHGEKTTTTAPRRTSAAAPNDYIVPGVLFSTTGGLSQFHGSIGLPRIAGDSCETFATVVCVALSCIENRTGLRHFFCPFGVNYLLFFSSWFHQITLPFWSDGGTKLRPTVAQVVANLDVQGGSLQGAVHVRRHEFLPVPYGRPDRATAAIEALFPLCSRSRPEEGADGEELCGYVIVAGDYAFSIATLTIRGPPASSGTSSTESPNGHTAVVGRTAVLADSHGELPWAGGNACLSAIKVGAGDEPAMSTDHGCHPRGEGLRHLCRILFVLLEHCRQHRRSAQGWASDRYSTWVPLYRRRRKPERPQAGVGPESEEVTTGAAAAGKVCQALDDQLASLLATSSAAQAAFRTGLRPKAAQPWPPDAAAALVNTPGDNPRNFFQFDPATHLAVAPRSCWLQCLPPRRPPPPSHQPTSVSAPFGGLASVTKVPVPRGPAGPPAAADPSHGNRRRPSVL